MRLPGGIRTTIAIALLAIVAGALGGAYLMVVPSLERRLVDDRLEELARDGEALANAYVGINRSNPRALDEAVYTASLLYRARAAVFQVLGPNPLTLSTLSDSAPAGGEISNDAVALETARTSAVVRGHRAQLSACFCPNA